MAAILGLLIGQTVTKQFTYNNLFTCGDDQIRLLDNRTKQYSNIMTANEPSQICSQILLATT